MSVTDRLLNILVSSWLSFERDNRIRENKKNHLCFLKAIFTAKQRNETTIPPIERQIIVTLYATESSFALVFMITPSFGSFP